MKRTAIYARYSSDNQRAESIDEQIRACRYYAQQTGLYDIVAVYKDEALSGYKNAHKRDGFAQLMADAEAGKFEAVMVYELSRFSRNGSDTIVNTEKLARLGIEFVSVREKLDQTPEGRMMMFVITGMNEYYSANLAIETMRGLKENAYQAKHTGGIPPLGYDLDSNGHYIINPEEAAAVRLIFDMYLEGNGYTAICDELNRRGYRTKRGTLFVRNSMYDLLRNEKYTGSFIYNHMAKAKNGKRNRHAYKSDSEVIRVENAFPAIISKEEYRKVLKLMEQNKRKGARNAAVHDYLLSGKVYCGHCGKSMYGETRYRKEYSYSYYSCNGHKSKICGKHSIRCDKLEAEVIRQLNELFFSDEILDRVSEKIYDDSQNHFMDERAAILRKRSADIKKKIDNGTKAILDGVDSDELRSAVKELSAQKKQIDQQIVQIEAAADNNGRTFEEVREMAKNFSDISKLPRDQQKRIVQKFIWRIYVYDSENPDDGDIVKIVLAPTEAARDELNSMAEDYVAITDMLTSTNGTSQGVPMKNPTCFSEQVGFYFLILSIVLMNNCRTIVVLLTLCAFAQSIKKTVNPVKQRIYAV